MNDFQCFIDSHTSSPARSVEVLRRQLLSAVSSAHALVAAINSLEPMTQWV